MVQEAKYTVKKKISVRPQKHFNKHLKICAHEMYITPRAALLRQIRLRD